MESNTLTQLRRISGGGENVMLRCM